MARLAAILGFVVLAAAGCRPRVPSGAKERTFAFGGRERSYVLYAGKTAKHAALVLVLHGKGGNGPAIEQRTKGTFDTLADQEGLVVVYPDAVDAHWNDGGPRSDTLFGREEDIDDVGFLSALSDSLTKEYDLDPKRVYATGLSNGGGMVFRLACERDQQIAAVAGVGATMSHLTADRCSSGRPLPVLVMHGTSDTIVPYHLVPREITLWTTRDGCLAPPNVTYLPDTDPNDGTRTRVEHFTDCNEGSEISFYAIEGGGHSWPGGTIRASFQVGATSRDFDAALVIWDFFKRHTLP